MNALSPLARAQLLLEQRIGDLEARIGEQVFKPDNIRLDPGAADLLWAAYVDTAVALALVTPQAAPGANGQLLTTKQLAERLQLSPRTIRRKVKAGELTPVRLGARGRGAVRWSAG